MAGSIMSLLYSVILEQTPENINEISFTYCINSTDTVKLFACLISKIGLSISQFEQYNLSFIGVVKTEQCR